MKRYIWLLNIVLALSLLVASCGPTPTEAPAPTKAPAAETIKIGFDIPLSGDFWKVGEESICAAEMLWEEINAAGGLEVGGKKYQLEFIYEDNDSKAESATAAALKLITVDKVLTIVGPLSSRQAVPTGEVAETNKTPMISPWSTNPRTTKDRPYVFRAILLNALQGSVIAKFATEEFGFTKAAVLYDVASDYPQSLAESFKSTFEEIHGEGSVVAFETITTEDRDCSPQLTKIKDSGADFLFTPQYYNEVPLIVQQAHELGWDNPILGSDSWGSAELMNLCGDDCKGSFFSTHYAAAGAKDATKEFIDAYNAKYGYVPYDDVAALTWDALGILLQAIQNTGGLTGNLEKDREAVKDKLGKTKDYEGITGKTSFFTSDGDPIKCAVIVKISDAGEFEFYKTVCPSETREATPVPPTPTEVPPEVTEVKLVAWTIGPYESSYYRRDNLIDATERLNTRLEEEGSPYRVKLDATFDTGSWGDYKTKFMMAAEAHKAPDIILSGHEDASPWSDAGFIIPLDDYIEKYWDAIYQDVIPVLWSACMYKGVKWAIPQDTDARLMYFSKRLLKEMDWSDEEIEDLPEGIRAGEFTLYDMLEVAKAAQDAGLVEPGYGYWTRPRDGPDFYTVYFGFGGEMQDPTTGKLVLDKDAFLKHLKFHHDTVFTYKTTPEGFIGTDWSVWHETVSAADKVLFWNGGTWQWAEWTTRYLGGNEQHLWDNVGFALFPASEPGLLPVEPSHPMVYMISAYCEYPELAFRILTEATSADLNSRHSVESGQLAILQSQLEHPKYQEARFLNEASYMVNYAVYLPNHALFGHYASILWNAVLAVMTGEVTSEEALEIVVGDLQAELGDEVIIWPQTVETGYVVAYGKYVASPYEVTIKDGAVYINDYLFEPRPPREEEPVDWSLLSNTEEEYEEAVELDKLFANKYAGFLERTEEDEEPEEAAQQLLRDFLRQYKEAEKVESYRVEDGYMYVLYKSGIETNLLLYTVSPAWARPTPSPSEKREWIKETKSTLIEDLEAGRLIAFGCDYTVTVAPDKSSYVVEEVRRIRQENIDREEKQKRLFAIIPSESFIMDILESVQP